MTQFEMFGAQPPKPPRKQATHTRSERTQAQVLRDQGMQQAIDNEREYWRALYRTEMRLFLKEQNEDDAFLPEEFRTWFLKRGRPEPHHYNVWGAMWRACATEGLVVKTGTHRPTTCAAGHATDGTEWKRGPNL